MSTSTFARLRRVARRAGRLILTPWRLYRQRTAVQLVVSHVLAVLVAVMLYFAAFVAAYLWPPASRLFNLEDIMIDPFLGEKARSVALYLGPETLDPYLVAGSDLRPAPAVDSLLARIVDGSVPGFDPPPGAVLSPRIDHIAILDLDGRIVAVSDPAWIRPGAGISAVPMEGSRYAVAQTLGLNGRIDPGTGSLFTLGVTNERTSAAFPIMRPDGTLIGVILVEGRPWSDVLGQDRTALARDLVETFFRSVWVFAIPAILVSIPFGIWRARTISSRLSRLADAADALAEGNASTRITVNRRDEVGRLAERFNEMGDHIQQSERMRRAFISNVSHELRTPVSIIQGTAEQELTRREHEADGAEPSWNIVLRETSMLTRLIGDLFTITRAEEQNLRLDRTAVNLAQVTEEGISGIREIAWTQSRVSIESLISSDLPPVLADPTRLRQIISNLLYNALRHTPAGGLVVLQARELESSVQVSTSDTGRGIPPEDLVNVFDRYFQSERGARHADSSGLGLSVVKQLVEAHGGTITVESIAGQGTTFRFTLPMARPQA